MARKIDYGDMIMDIIKIVALSIVGLFVIRALLGIL